MQEDEEMTKDKIEVTKRSLIQRLNRALAPDQVLKSNRRSDRMIEEIGEYCILDLKQKRIVQRHVDLLQLAKKLGAIEAWEEIGE
jgi:hypothetical protein